MRIVFLSGGARHRALQALIDQSEEIVAVVTPKLSEKNSRFAEVIAVAEEQGIPVLQIKKSEVLETLKKLDYDILVSCGFPYILSEEVLELSPWAINVHPTLLPKYRGYRSGPYIILNNESQSGVTVHHITKDMDRGNILGQRAFPVTVFDTTKSVFRKAQETEPALLAQVVRQIQEGTVQETAQDESQATEYTYMRTPKDSEIDPRKSLEELYNEIRACDPEDYPAFFTIDGQKVCIKLWRPEKPADEADMI